MRYWMHARLMLGAPRLFALAILALGCREPGQKRDAVPGRTVPPEVSVREEVRIGSAEWSGYQFHRVMGAAWSAAGELFVLTDRPHAVLVFSSEGKPVRRFGRPGSGPGEFRIARAIAVSHDTVYIVDVGLMAFSTDGRVLFTTEPAGQPGSGYSNVEGFTVSPKGPLWMVYQRVSRRLAADTAVVSTWHRGSGFIRQRAIPAAEPEHLRVTLGAHRYFALSTAGSIIRTSGDRWELEVFDLDSGAARSIRKDVAPRRVTDSDLASLRVFADTISDTFTRDGFLRVLDESPRPTFFPVLGRILAGEDSTVLVERLDLARAVEANAGTWMTRRAWQQMASRFGPSQWDVVRLNGDIVGRVTLPARFAPLSYTRRGITGIVFDADDVGSIVLLSLG
jgi:hypothetical protein